MARVNITNFTQAMNDYNGIVSAIQNEINAMSTAAQTLRAGISGDEASTQALYNNIAKRQGDLESAMSSIKGVITLVQNTNENYHRDLEILT